MQFSPEHVGAPKATTTVNKTFFNVAVIVPNYNSANLVTRCVSAMLDQDLPAGVTMDIMVVDDGSTDGSVNTLHERFGDSIRLIRLAQNHGRSTARNSGAEATDAELLIFVDSDCIPTNRAFVTAHLASLAADADISFGQVCAPGTGFWDRLQQDTFAERLRRFHEGDTWIFTTQNVAIRAELFRRAGGFDAVFDRYGFEDRDLFLRLARLGGKAVFSEHASVLHEDRISLTSVSRKLGEAGFHYAREFHRRHPAAYRRMPFSRLDCELHPWLMILDAIASPWALYLAKGPAVWLEWTWLPFSLRAKLARIIYGMSYLHGTVRRRQLDDSKRI